MATPLPECPHFKAQVETGVHCGLVACPEVLCPGLVLWWGHTLLQMVPYILSCSHQLFSKLTGFDLQ